MENCPLSLGDIHSLQDLVCREIKEFEKSIDRAEDLKKHPMFINHISTMQSTIDIYKKRIKSLDELLDKLTEFSDIL